MSNDYFAHRATVRQYSGKRIPDEVINDVLGRAMHAPTCGNMQLYSVIVTRDPGKKRLLEEQHFNQPAATGSDVILTVCADFHRFSQWCEASRAKPCYDNFHSFVMALTDAVILCQQIVTIAEMEGIGTCYLGTVNYNAKAISDLLNLPELVVPVASLSLGYPAGEQKPTERLPLEAVVFNETYPKRADEEILALYSEEDNNPENRQFVKENNKESLAQVFTDVRYPLSTNLAVSESFLSLLREKGFMTEA